MDLAELVAKNFLFWGSIALVLAGPVWPFL